ncbi:MAG: MFS transporter small subunit [Isosphaeraceae bacterium]
MNEAAGKTSVLRLAAAWLVVTIPLAWGVYQTAVKALPLFHEAAAAAAIPPSTAGSAR